LNIPPVLLMFAEEYFTGTVEKASKLKSLRHPAEPSIVTGTASEPHFLMTFIFKSARPMIIIQI